MQAYRIGVSVNPVSSRCQKPTPLGEQAMRIKRGALCFGPIRILYEFDPLASVAWEEPTLFTFAIIDGTLAGRDSF